MASLRIWLGVGLVAVIAVGAAVVWADKEPAKLETALKVEKADLGIPGITKTYDASVVNQGWRRVRVTRCNFIDDTMSRGTMVAYAIQRWSEKEMRWQEVMGASRTSFCHPYPLGIVKADLTTSWLWPGQSLSIGEEATAARDGLEIGNRVRFVIFLGEPGDYTHSLASPEFTVDEHPTSDVDFRVRH